MAPHSSPPAVGNFLSDNLTLGAGVAIFHLRTKRVVVCYHTKEHHWFLPKGRLNANEDPRRAAEREGFEESGYRNRLLPIPIRHRQPDPDDGPQPFVTQPIWTQLAPVTPTTQYILFWYAAETLPSDLELSYKNQTSTSGSGQPIYSPPASYPPNLTISDRIAADDLTDDDGNNTQYEPVRHDGTGVNDDELSYTSFLLPIDEACYKLGKGVMADVIRRGWAGVELRMVMEDGKQT